jgi:hypothetical protein
LACAADVNQPVDNMDTMKKNTETLIYASKEVGVQVHVEKAQYMLLTHHHSGGQNHAIKVTDPVKKWHSLNICKV